MGMFSDLMRKIFQRGEAERPADIARAPNMGGGGAAGTAARPVGTPASAPAATAELVDVEAVLTKLESESKQKLDWRHSIVDLMKLVGMDSSLANRKELAKELNYTGDTSDSAAMNIWLHKQVMKKLSENGGKVPASLLD
jgi:hypothetical protein